MQQNGISEILINHALWRLWLFALLSPLIISILNFTIFALTRKTEPKGLKIGDSSAIYAVGLLGIVVGLMTGLSREAAVGAVLPSILGIVGGLSIYISGKEENRTFTAVSLISLAFMMLVGVSVASTMREYSDEYKTGSDYQKRAALIEADVKSFRKNLGLEIEKCK